MSLSCLIFVVVVERWWLMTTRGGKGVYNTNPAVMVLGGRSNAALSQQDCRTDADALRFCSRLIQSAESRSCITTEIYADGHGVIILSLQLDVWTPDDANSDWAVVCKESRVRQSHVSVVAEFLS